MKTVSLVVEPFFQNNRIFDVADPIVNRDNCMMCFWTLRERFLEAGFEMATQDIHSPETSDAVIYVEMPKQLPATSMHDRAYLLLFESALIRPDNWDFRKHRAFRRVFTWHSDWVDGERYIKTNFSHQFDQAMPKQDRDRFCCLIAGNKYVADPRELYSERVKTIRWFEQNHPEQFDLYGVGWDQFIFRNKLSKFLNKISPLRKALKHCDVFPSYRGKVDSKCATLSRYQFCICYENAEQIPGYITEKLFDCFFAGVIPIYWGAPDIADYIPKETYIDRTQFSCHEDLYAYLVGLSEKAKKGYLDAIESFLNSQQFQPFSVDDFAKTIVEHVNV